jgi:DnaJ-class molecular chaperone
MQLTLSDPQKRTIDDGYGEEDPDNRGGGGARRAGGMHMGPGQDVSQTDGGQGLRTVSGRRMQRPANISIVISKEGAE